ncbi:hypothetical protein GCM10009681_51070 [Luedemannella helvata]|uniref:Uncharacterized protein n=1 Tax=Luedemannella helvata TaxID=349315 RepID=A0ABP4XCE5_9ACTN
MSLWSIDNDVWLPRREHYVAGHTHDSFDGRSTNFAPLTSAFEAVPAESKLCVSTSGEFLGARARVTGPASAGPVTGWRGSVAGSGAASAAHREPDQEDSGQQRHAAQERLADQ